jgi:hypothetical protein
MNENEQKQHYIKLFHELIDINKIPVCEGCAAMLAIIIPALLQNGITKEAFLLVIENIFDEFKKRPGKKT